ncbi:E3 ubiquitin-protein ligase ATL6 [Linum grandiflorum]
MMKSLPDDDRSRALFSASEKHYLGKALAIIIFAFIFLRLLSIFLRVRRQPFPYYNYIALLGLLLHQRWNHDHDDYGGNYYFYFNNNNNNNNSDDRQKNQEGVQASVMETLPVLRYSDVRELIRNKMLRETVGCAICLSDYIQGERLLLRILPKCDHVFHLKCIDRWLTFHVTCPVCRAVLTADSDDKFHI